MTVTYSNDKRNVTPPKPQRYEVQWMMFRGWEHWSWHRFKWTARAEIYVCGFYGMRVVDHGKKRYTGINDEGNTP